MDKVYIIGSYSTAFGRRRDDSVKDLTREAYRDLYKHALLSVIEEQAGSADTPID